MGKKNIIEVYAICDGIIDSIDNFADPAFKDSMMGQGYFINATSDLIYAPINDAKVDLIFESSYGLFIKPFKIESSIMVNMCPEFTVEDSKYFEILVNNGDNVENKKVIAKIKTAYLNVVHQNSNIVVLANDETNKLKWKFKPHFKGPTPVKKNDLVGIFEVSKEKEMVKNATNYFQSSTNWDYVAREIIDLVGRKANYSNSYKCSTRLRFAINNRENVDLEQLEKIKSIKGIVWKENELQIIFGRDVNKVYKSLKVLEDSGNFEIAANQKLSFGRSLIAAISGVMMPLIPVLIAAGILMAAVGLFQIVGLMPNILLKAPPSGVPEGSVLINEANVGWAILYSLANSPLRFLGMLAGLTAARYFKLNIVVGLTLSIILGSPLIFGDGGAQGFGYTWDLFKTGLSADPKETIWYGLSSIKVMPQGARVVVVILAIYLAKKIDILVEPRIKNKVLQLIFKDAIVLGITALVSFFIIGPIWYVIEQLIGVILNFASSVPLGISVGLYALVWQPLVILGMHMAVGQIAQLQEYTVGVSYLTPGGEISVWGQVGAVVGVILISKNSALKRTGRGTIISGFFGVPAPIVYGVNLPKIRPFLAGCLGAFIGGCAANILGVASRVTTGMGVFAWFGFFSQPINPAIIDSSGVQLISNLWNGVYMILACLVSLFTAFGFTVLLYKERFSENSLIKNINKKIVKLIQLNNSEISKDQLKIICKEFNENMGFFNKEEIKKIKMLEKDLIEDLKYKTTLEVLLEKESNIKNKEFNKGVDLIKKGQIGVAEQLMSKHEQPLFIAKKQEIQIKIDAVEAKITPDLIWINKIVSEKEQKTLECFNKYCDFLPQAFIGAIIAHYKNATNDLKIVYKIDDPIKLDYQISQMKKILIGKNKTKQYHNKTQKVSL